MALIKCIECGKEISDKAMSCPSCGSPTNLAAKKSEAKNELVSVFLGLIFIGAFVGIPVYMSLRAPCIKSAKEQLNDPDSMKVISYDRESKLLTVSAKNGFGSRRRVKFECIGDFAYSQWNAYYLNLFSN